MMDREEFPPFLSDQPVWSSSSGQSLGATDSLWDTDDIDRWPDASEFLTADSLTGISNLGIDVPWSFESSDPVNSCEPVTTPHVGEGLSTLLEQAITPTDGDSSMKNQLRLAIRTTEGDKVNKFLPLSALHSIVNYDAVASQLRLHFPHLSPSAVDLYAARICAGDPMAASETGEKPSCRRLAAILAIMQRIESLIPLIDEGITDLDLPLRMDTTSSGISTVYELRRKNADPSSGPISTTLSWPRSQVELFERIQWLMCAPVFHNDKAESTDVDFLELGDSSALPWLKTYECYYNVRGSSCSLWRCDVEPSHTFGLADHDGSQGSFPFAIKQLKSHRREDFDHEVRMLNRYSSRSHPHLIHLAGTYRRRGKYHLVFPWADMNLREYWRNHPDPTPDVSTTRWVATESRGIASGLLLIHNGGIMKQVGDEEAVANRTDTWCAHQDLKPDNILFFSKRSRTKGIETGTWKISDFGLCEDRADDGVYRSKRGCTHTYRAPEYDIGKSLGSSSRAMDIWALACTFLECLTWLLEGWKGVVHFAGQRSTQTRPGVLSDEYFETVDKGGAFHTRLKPSVVLWSSRLYQHQHSSRFVRDFLELIVNRMFVIRNEDRVSCGMVFVRLDEMAKKCLDLVSYCMPSTPGEPPWVTIGYHSRLLPIEGQSPSDSHLRSLTDEAFNTSELAQSQISPPHAEKRKRSGSQEDIPEFDQEMRSRKATKTHESVSDVPADSSGQRFACPFFKNNPRKFRTWRICGGPGWHELHRMKEHLYRRHSLGGYRCQRCQLRCKDAASLAEHLKATDICTLVDVLPDGMMSPAQEQVVRQRKRGLQKSVEEQWFDIYKLLFPNAEIGATLSPYYEDLDIQPPEPVGSLDRPSLTDFKEYLSGGIPSHLQRRIEDKVKQELSLAHGRQSGKLAGLLPQLLLDLCEAYEDARRA